MTRDRALERIEKLMALAASASGASEEEARSAAVQAVRLMAEHGLTPGAASPTSGIDLDSVARLSFRVIELEKLLDERRRTHAQELRDHDRRWRAVVEDVRREERAAAHRSGKTLSRVAALKERETLARSGGEARARTLDPERKREIGRQGARARWARWRERHTGRSG